MKMFVGGTWISGKKTIDVINPFDGSVVDTVPEGTAHDVQAAIGTLVHGARLMAQMPAWKRSQILVRSAELIGQNRESLARCITQEEGKTINEARGEVDRARDTMQISAEEAMRIEGRVIPLDQNARGENKLGFTLRVPCGIVAAITPFNFPLNLVCHKVGPALAAGNAALIKPASDTPLSALHLVELLLEAGVPPEAIACVTGPGKEIGNAICDDQRVRKISFTGSVEVGQQISHRAGLKRLTMELGANCPLVVMPDADLNQVADAIVSTGYANAGQVCLSTQRVIAIEAVHNDLLDRLIRRVPQIRTGDPAEESTQMGPLVRQSDAERVEKWIDEAKQQGAKVAVGGQRDAAAYAPSVIHNVSRDMRLFRDELFGPAVALIRAGTLEAAIELANDSNYGLSAAIFTRDLDTAMAFARQVDTGNIHINYGPQWRMDSMPYGGLKQSGFGKEGPRWAIQEMTEEKMVVYHGR